MLDRPAHAAPAPLGPSKERLLSSVSGVLGELKQLLLSSRDPIAPDTGAQIAQMLRAIREGASIHALDDIAHCAIDIEMYLISREPYGPHGAMRNVVLSSQVDELIERVAVAMANSEPLSGEPASTQAESVHPPGRMGRPHS